MIIPLVRPTILNLIVLSFIGKMKIFDLVWITTKGGPLWSTETVSTYVYKRAFEWIDVRPRLSVDDRRRLVRHRDGVGARAHPPVPRSARRLEY